MRQLSRGGARPEECLAAVMRCPPPRKSAGHRPSMRVEKTFAAVSERDLRPSLVGEPLLQDGWNSLHGQLRPFWGLARE
jgi:hypothetical protein